jgi:tripartite-type tricarboxylate transporter receptor subunit TctC
MRRRTLFAVVVSATALVASVQSIAAAYPSKPLQLLIPLRPGGAGDIITHEMAPKMSAVLGQPLVLEKLPTRQAIAALEAVAKAPADGYTLALGSTSTMAVNPLLIPGISYDPLKSFTPVSLLVRTPMALVVGAGFKATSLRELLAIAKTSPGKLSYGTAGVGTLGHLTGELFKFTVGVDLLHKPNTGGTEAIADAEEGQVTMGFVSLAAALPQLRTGKLRAVAVTSVQRAAAAPSVPTTAESGVPGVVITEWFGIVAPAGTPPAVVSRLNSDINAVLQMPELQARFSERAFEPTIRTLEYFDSLIKSDLGRMGDIVKRARITGSDVRSARSRPSQSRDGRL